MMMLLRELQDLQMWLLNRGSELVFGVVFSGCYFYSVTASFTCDKRLICRTVDVVKKKPFNENLSNLEDFMNYVTNVEYESEKSKPNQTPT